MRDNDMMFVSKAIYLCILSGLLCNALSDSEDQHPRKVKHQEEHGKCCFRWDVNVILDIVDDKIEPKHSGIVTEISIGTPNEGTKDQKSTVLLTTTLPDANTYVFNGAKCGTEHTKNWRCKADKVFKSWLSSTYEKKVDGKIESTNAEIGTDKITIGKTSITQKFGLLEPKADENEKSKSELKFDGEMSLMYAGKVESLTIPTFPVNLMNELEIGDEDKSLVIWLEDKQPFTPNGTGRLSIGLDKESNCNKDTWKHVDVVKPTDDGIWRLKLDLFKAGEFVKNGSVVDIKAVISTESIGIGLPKDAFDEVMKKIKLVDVAKSLAECKLRSDLPNLVFQIGGNMYEVSPQQYLIDYKGDGEKCYVALYESGGIPQQYMLGHSFLRSYCVALEYKSVKQVAFADRNSAFAFTVSLLPIFMSLLSLNVQKFF